MVSALSKHGRLGVYVSLVFLPWLTLEHGPTSLRGRAPAQPPPSRALQEEKVSRLGGRPALGALIHTIGNDTDLSAVASDCGIAVVDFPSGDVAVAYCAANTVVLKVATLEPEDFTMIFMQNVSASFSAGEHVHDMVLAALDSNTLLVAYCVESSVLLRKALLSSDGQSFQTWSAEIAVSASGVGHLGLEALGDTRALLAFTASNAARFCIVSAVDELEVGPGCDDADITEEHKEMLAATAVRIFWNSALDMVAVAVGSGKHQGSAWFTQLDVSTLTVQWGVLATIEISSEIIEGPIDAVSVGSDGEMTILFGTSNSLFLWCGAAEEGGLVQGNASVIPGSNKSLSGKFGQAKVDQLETGAVLVAYSQANGPSYLRFANCQPNNLVQWGPTATSGDGSVLRLLSVPISDAYGFAVLASSAGLTVATDFRCQAGGNTIRYDITRCDGTKASSRCELTCAAEAVGTNAIAECYEEEGQFEFQGCIAPSCVLPTITKEHRGFNFSDCNTTLMGPLRAEDCILKCRSGAAGALAVCSSHLGDFQLVGCNDAECTRPDDTTGYDASSCDTTDGPLPAYLCQIACADDYSGTELEVTCVEDFEGGPGIFEFLGCKGKCSAPTGIENAAWPSCNGSLVLNHEERCDAVCLQGFEPQPAQLRCVNGRMTPEDFECRENVCEAPKGVEHAPEFPCETGQLILPNQPCDTICDMGYVPTVDQLMCSKGFLNPRSHTCLGRNCFAPKDVANAKDPPCMEGQEVSHLGVCTGSCQDGYTAFPELLTCNASKLQPATFICGKNCLTPQGIEHALTPACDTGDQILHGQNCIPFCEEGYMPLVNEMAGSGAYGGSPQLRCDNGDLVPPYFSCAPRKCSAPEGIELAGNPACREGWSLGHGQVCTAQCMDGFAPEPPFLECKSMLLQPSTFTCEASKCAAPAGIVAADPGSSCAEGVAIPHGQPCTPRCQFGHAPSELQLSCVHGEFQPRAFECRSVTHISPAGVAAIRVAPFSNPQESIADRAVVAFLDSHAGLRARHVHIRNGAADAGHNGVDEAKDDISLEAREQGNEVLTRSMVLLPSSGNQVLAVYARREICGTGRIEIVALMISFTNQGTLRRGNKVQLIMGPTDLLPTLAGVALGAGTGITAVVATSGIACLARQSGSQVSISASSAFSSTTVQNLAITALGSSVLFLVYSSASCVRAQRGQVQGNNIQWQSREAVIADGACLEPGALALDAVASNRVLFAAGTPEGRGALSIITSDSQGTDWGGMEPIVQSGGFGNGPIVEVACALVAMGSPAPALIAYQQGGLVRLHWYTVAGNALQRSSAQRHVSGVSSVPLSLSLLGPRVAALIYTDLGKSWQGAVRVFADQRCSLPASIVGYDDSACRGSAVYASQCRMQCLAPHSGYVETACSEEGGSFSLTGCSPPCVAPDVASAQTPACIEGEFVKPGTYCTASCLPGYKPNVRRIGCWYEDGVPKMEQSFSCEPQGCAAPTCIDNAAFPSCAEGWHIRHGAACMPECKPGFIPSVDHLACDATTLTPSAFRCERVGSPCSVDSLLGFIAGAADKPCLEGAVILDGAGCTPLCDGRGRVPTVEKLSCVAGELQPSTFECAAPCLAPTAVPNSLAPPCAEGFRVSHGQVCTLRCKFGYQAQPTTLSCNRGLFEEDAGDGSALYTCVLTAKSCDSPQSVLHLNLGERRANASQGLNFCREGAVIAHGSECNAQCEFSSYSSDPPKLFCNDGLLTPPTFRCGRFCDSGTLLGYIRNSKTPVCKGGVRIRHSENCIPNCKEGYAGSSLGSSFVTSDSRVQSLECFDGSFTPPGFACAEVRDGCDAPTDVESAQLNTCLEGAYIENGGICTAACDEGFMPDVAKLRCSDRELTPSTFSCFVLCQAPSGVGYGGFCQEGAAIAHNHQCTASCAPGFLPSVSSLRCQFGSLAPSTFKCHRYCTATVGVAAMYRDAEAGLKLIGDPACKEGDTIEHGKSCATLCSVGYVASVGSLSCDEGALNPPQFSCTAGLQCFSPEKIDDAGIPSCVEGSSVPHDSSCTPTCQSGFLPSRTSLYCWNGELSPADFECIPGCAAPSDPNAPNPACVEGKFIMPGDYCTARCRENFSPTAPRLRCSTSGSGSFSPDGFTCGRDCGTPSVVFAGNPPCLDGVPVRNAQICSLNCSTGYAGFGQLVCHEGDFIPDGPGRCLQECRAPPTKQTPQTHYPVHYLPQAAPHVSETGEHDVRVARANNHTLVGVLQNQGLWSELEIHDMQGNLSILNGIYRLEARSNSRRLWKKPSITPSGSLYIVSFRAHADSLEDIWCITEDVACESWLLWASLERDVDPGAVQGLWYASDVHWNASERPSPVDADALNTSNSSSLEKNTTPTSPKKSTAPAASSTSTSSTTSTTFTTISTTTTVAGSTTVNQSSGVSSNDSTPSSNASQGAPAERATPSPTPARTTQAPTRTSTTTTTTTTSTTPASLELAVGSGMGQGAAAPAPVATPAPPPALTNWIPAAVHIAVVNAIFTFVLSPMEDGSAHISRILRSPEHFKSKERNMTWQLSQLLPPRSIKRVVLESDVSSGFDLGVTLSGGLGSPFFVVHVINQSEAATAGVHPGDELISIGPRRTAEMTRSMRADALFDGPLRKGSEFVFAGPIAVAQTMLQFMGESLHIETDVAGGLIVRSVSLGGPADLAGVRPGYVLTSLNGNAVGDYTQFGEGNILDSLKSLQAHDNASVNLIFTKMGRTTQLIDNAPFRSCVRGFNIPHGQDCQTRCNPSYLPFIKTLACNDGQLRPPGYTCVRNGNLTFGPNAVFHRGASFGAKVAALHNTDLVAMSFVDGGHLFVVIGSRGSDGYWFWGQPLAYTFSMDQGHNFLNQIVALSDEAFVLAFRDHVGRAAAVVGLLQPAALEFSLGCEHYLNTEAFDELGMAVLGSTSRVLFVQVIGRGPTAHAVLRVGSRRNSLLALQLGAKTGLNIQGVAHIAVAAFDDNRVAVAFNTQDEMAGAERGAVVVVEVDKVTASLKLGSVQVFNEAPTLHISLAVLSRGRLAVAFLDSRELVPETSVRLAYSQGLVLTWGERHFAGDAPAMLLSMTLDGPLLVAASKSALWLAVWELSISLGKQTPLDVDDYFSLSAPSGVSLQNNTVALLLPQDDHVSTMRVAELQWTCLLPRRMTELEGYDTSLCRTGDGSPLSVAECALSCAYGYEAEGPLIPECPPPPAAAIFKLVGCKPQGCVQPTDITNAADPACAEGRVVESGSICTPKCLPGYEPSEIALTCKAGKKTPSMFTCMAICCLQHSMRMMTGPVPAQIALEGNFYSAMFTAVNVLEDDGDGQGSVWLAKPKGSSWFVMDLGSIYFLHEVHMRNTYGLGWSTTAFSLKGSLHGGDAANWLPIFSGVLQPGFELQTFMLHQSTVSLRVRFVRFHLLNYTGNGGGLGFMQLFGINAESSGKGIQPERYPECAARLLPRSSCAAPEGIPNAKWPSCVEGTYVRSGSTCKPACAVGYVRSVASLVCDNGRLEPAVFSCIRADTIQEVTGSKAATEDSSFLLVVDIGMNIEDVVDTETRAYLLSELSYKSEMYAGLFQGFQVALGETGGGHVCMFEAKSAGAAPKPNASSDIVARSLSSEDNSDLNVSLQIVVENRSVADPIVNRISSVMSGGEVVQILESELGRLWLPLLNASGGQQLLGTGWLEIFAHPGVPALTMTVLTAALARTFSEEMQQHILEYHPELRDFVQRNDLVIQSDGEEEEYDDTFFRFLLGPAWPIIRKTFGDWAPVVVSIGLFVFVILYFVQPPVCYYTLRVRHRAQFRDGNPGERQFRALYIVPESHRYRWRIGKLKCLCGCRKRICRWCCCCCCRRCQRCRCRSCWCLTIPTHLQLCCTLCCCPCLRVPETWHVAGLLHFWTGVAVWYCLPCCVPCLGLCMRIRMRKLFALPNKAVRDCYTWCCCWWAAAMQEAMHVDGAAEALQLKAQEAEDQDKKLKRHLEMQAIRETNLRQAAKRRAEEKADRRAEKKGLAVAPRQSQMRHDGDKHPSVIGAQLEFASEESSALSRRRANKKSAKIKDPHALPELTPVGRSSLKSVASVKSNVAFEELPDRKRSKKERKKTRRMDGHSVVIRAKKKKKDPIGNPEGGEEEPQPSESSDEDMYTDASSSQGTKADLGDL